MKTLSLNLAKKLIEASEQKAKSLGLSMVISIVDEGGHKVHQYLVSVPIQYASQM